MIADPVQQEVPAPSVAAGLDHLQYKNGVVGEAGRKIALASVGFCAYIVDGAVAVYNGGVRSSPLPSAAASA